MCSHYLHVGSGGKLASFGCRRQAGKRTRRGYRNHHNDPFQPVPGSIPGSCIPAFTGTPLAISGHHTTRGPQYQDSSLPLHRCRLHTLPNLILAWVSIKLGLVSLLENEEGREHPFISAPPQSGGARDRGLALWPKKWKFRHNPTHLRLS